jgi:DUF1365 family protein
MNTPLLGIGTVRHARLRPVRHAFSYPALFLRLPMRSWDGRGALARNRFAAISFHDADHGDGGTDALRWRDALLAREGIHDAGGEAWLQCFPRVFGHAFKPVSFWFCHRRDGSLRAVVAEVNNTFGERHCYVLDAPRWGGELRAAKAFHVSPFCPVEGEYRFRFLQSADATRTVARIDYDDVQGPLLQTSVSGRLRPATSAALRAAALRFPFAGLVLLARIHWHALRLSLRGVPFFRQPPPPPRDTTRQRPA